MINYSLLPEGLRAGMQRYVEHGIHPGRLIEACLKDSLTGAFAQADENNRDHMFDIACFLHNELPLTIWGSHAVVEGWIEQNRAAREGDDLPHFARTHSTQEYMRRIRGG